MKSIFCTCVLAAFVTTLVMTSPALGQGFNESFEGGLPADWFTFGTDRGTLLVSDGVASLKSTTGGTPTFGFATDILHGDVVSEIKAQFVKGDADTFLFNNLRDFRDGATANDQGQYWAAVSPTGEIGVGYSEPDGRSAVSVRGEFLQSGPIGVNDIVNVRTEVIGSTIVHSAWLEGSDPETGATVTWTDRRNRYPTGELAAISFNGNVDDEVLIHSYGLTAVPEPTGVTLLIGAVLGGSLLFRRQLSHD